MIKGLDHRVLDKVRAHSAPGTVNVLSTASPACYTRHVAEHLGWELIPPISKGTASGTTMGAGKVSLLHERFPPEAHVYHFAIADSRSDLPLLELFRHHELLAGPARDA